MLFNRINSFSSLLTEKALNVVSWRGEEGINQAANYIVKQQRK